MDWHISGFWVINSPVAWIRVYNFNDVPIKDVTIEYTTYDATGKELDRGMHTIPESVIPPGGKKDCIEQYLGLVSLYTERLSIKFVSVQRD